MAVLGLQLALPYDYRVPAEPAQLDAFLDVTLFVAFYFPIPILDVALRHGIVLASFVAVPETAVDENGCPVFGHDNVGRAGELPHVYSVAVASGVQVAAYEHLGLGVLALYARHATAPLLLCFIEPAFALFVRGRIPTRSLARGFCHIVGHVANILFYAE